MMRGCFDKRTWSGLGVLAAGLLTADPRVGWAALAGLAGLACLVSMLFMMRGMRRDAGSIRTAPVGEPAAGDGSATGDRAAEIARLRRQIRQLRADAGDITGARAEADPASRGATGVTDPAGRRRSMTGG